MADDALHAANIFDAAFSALNEEQHFHTSEVHFRLLWKTGKGTFSLMTARQDGKETEKSSDEEVDVTPIDWASTTLCAKDGEQFIESIKTKYPWRCLNKEHALVRAIETKEDVKYVGGNGYDSAGVQKIISMVIRQRNLGTEAKYVFGKEKRKSPVCEKASTKKQRPASLQMLECPVPRARSPTFDLEARCRAYETEVMDLLPMTNDTTVRDVVQKAHRFIAAKEEEGDRSVAANVIFLGRIPELANMREEMTTSQVVKFIKDKFKTMKPEQFNNRGWYGVECYFEGHPMGKETHGYVAIKGWMSVDHVLAQYFGMFHHPRFYALMPPAINAHLRESPPITRMGFGMSRADMGLMHTWMKHIEKTARQKKLQNLLLDNLVSELPVAKLA